MSAIQLPARVRIIAIAEGRGMTALLEVKNLTKSFPGIGRGQ